MVLEINVLKGGFYKRNMFQPKYHWVEIKYLGAMQNRRRQLFSRRDVFSKYTAAIALTIFECQRELERLYSILRYLRKYSKYSDLNSFT